MRFVVASLPHRQTCRRLRLRCAMDRESRPLTKPERQRLIESVLIRRRVGTQLELRAALAAAGCAVAQATLSRDLRELEAEKATDELGRPRYVLRGRSSAHDPRSALADILARYARGLTAAQNIVVIRSELGSA